MQLRNRYYLSDIEQAKAKYLVEKQKSALIKPLWIIPRSWCVTGSLYAKGIPRNKIAAFAQLHIGRLAPFPDSSAYAVRTGDWIYIWFWENSRVRGLCEKFGLNIADLDIAPESVCFPPKEEGAVWLKGQDGYEAQLWHESQMLESGWWEVRPAEDEWQQWRQSSIVTNGPKATLAVWPETLPSLNSNAVISTTDNEYFRLAEPWAPNLIKGHWWGALIKNASHIFIPAALAGVVCLLSSYVVAEWWVTRSVQKDVDGRIAALADKVEPFETAKAEALKTRDWVTSVAGLSNGTAIWPLISEIKEPLLRRGATIREIEIQQQNFRITLIPIGPELDISGVTDEFQKNPMFADVKLLPESDVRQVRLAARIVNNNKSENIVKK